MASEVQETDQDRYKALKVVVDVLAALSVAYVFIVHPVWLNGHTIVYGTVSSKTPTQMWLALLGCVPGVYGAPWLIHRYKAIVARKFAITRDWRFLGALVLGLPLLMFIGIIVRFWR